MKALSLWQPWASLIACGVKTVETRSWSTTYRGELAIHASKGVHAAQETNAILGWTRAAVSQLTESLEDQALPRGEVVAVAQLVDVVPIEEALERFPDQEPFGDFRPGRFGWILERIRPLGRGVQFAGRQGLWKVPDDLERQVLARAPDAG